MHTKRKKTGGYKLYNLPPHHQRNNIRKRIMAKKRRETIDILEIVDEIKVKVAEAHKIFEDLHEKLRRLSRIKFIKES